MLVLSMQETELRAPHPSFVRRLFIREKFGEVAGKRIVIVGDILHSRVALSNIFALNMLGAEVKFAAPRVYCPNTSNPWG